MLKRILSVLLATMIVASATPCVTTSATAHAEIETIYLQDGSYIEIEIIVQQSRALNTKTASKTYNYRGANGDLQWTGKVTGTFEYNGTTSTCTGASCSVTITNTSWYTMSKSASKSGNTAYGYLTMGYDYLGVRIDTENLTMSLTCDQNGKLS